MRQAGCDPPHLVRTAAATYICIHMGYSLYTYTHTGIWATCIHVGYVLSLPPPPCNCSASPLLPWGSSHAWLRT